MAILFARCKAPRIVADFQCTCKFTCFLVDSGGEVSLLLVKSGVQEVVRVFFHSELDV